MVSDKFIGSKKSQARGERIIAGFATGALIGGAIGWVPGAYVGGTLGGLSVLVGESAIRKALKKNQKKKRRR